MINHNYAPYNSSSPARIQARILFDGFVSLVLRGTPEAFGGGQVLDQLRALRLFHLRSLLRLFQRCSQLVAFGGQVFGLLCDRHQLVLLLLRLSQGLVSMSVGDVKLLRIVAQLDLQLLASGCRARPLLPLVFELALQLANLKRGGTDDKKLCKKQNKTMRRF